MASQWAHPSGTPNAQVWRPDWLVTATMNWMTANTRHASWKAKQIQPMTQHPKLKFCAAHALACQLPQHVHHDLHEQPSQDQSNPRHEKATLPSYTQPQTRWGFHKGLQQRPGLASSDW